MFEFNSIEYSADKPRLSAGYRIDHSILFFKGFFDNLPIIPAAAQLQMPYELVDSEKNWLQPINREKKVKFNLPVVSDDYLQINRVKSVGQDIHYQIQNQHNIGVIEGMLCDQVR